MRKVLAFLFGAALYGCTFVTLIAFPVIAATAVSTDVVTNTTHVISLPAAIAAGDLLLVAFYGSATDGVPHAAATGWTVIGDNPVTDNVGHLTVMYRVADGMEGATVSATTDLAEDVAGCAYRITGQHTVTTPYINVGPPRGVSLNPDPALLTPPWDLEDTTYIAIAGADSSLVDFTVYPTNYDTAQITTATHTSGGGACAMAARDYTSLSDDPGTFTIDTSNVRWLSFTVAIRNAPPPLSAPRRIL